VNRIVKPRTVAATSIPAMLQTFQNEFDALMVETYELRKQVDQ
jgi:pre-mRNA-processing factor 19